ncbi:hypothetical protein niasHT_020381 [Heterodera trifolii]|uniref:SSD domain-containing protein n=1 Tax=Heterodera trifolii TaxID=157864 RepID=A0ABD2JXG5_9BILA
MVVEVVEHHSFVFLLYGHPLDKLIHGRAVELGIKYGFNKISVYDNIDQVLEFMRGGIDTNTRIPMGSMHSIWPPKKGTMYYYMDIAAINAELLSVNAAIQTLRPHVTEIFERIEELQIQLANAVEPHYGRIYDQLVRLVGQANEMASFLVDLLYRQWVLQRRQLELQNEPPDESWRDGSSDDDDDDDEDAIGQPKRAHENMFRRSEKGTEDGTESDGQTTGWEETERRRVRIQLDGTTHSTILDDELGLKLSMLGLNGAKSAGALDSGVYFVENHSDGTLDEITGKIAVNRITENDFHKLGWFRLDEKGPPFVQHGEVFLDKSHHARADAEQRFKSVLDASYYVNGHTNLPVAFFACFCHFVACATALGTLFFFGLRNGSILGITPFLIIEIGIDDAFLTIHSWQLTIKRKRKNGELKIPTNSKSLDELLTEQLSEILEDTGPAILISALTNITSDLVGMWTGSPEITLLCIGNIASISFDFFYQITLFTAVLICARSEFKAELKSNEQNHNSNSTSATGTISSTDSNSDEHNDTNSRAKFTANFERIANPPDLPLLEVDNYCEDKLVPFYTMAQIFVNNPGDLSNNYVKDFNVSVLHDFGFFLGLLENMDPVVLQVGVILSCSHEFIAGAPHNPGQKAKVTDTQMLSDVPNVRHGAAFAQHAGIMHLSVEVNIQLDSVPLGRENLLGQV